MEYTQMTLDDWMGMKERLKKDLIGVQESFVRIGYTLRQIEGRELYKQDGFKSIAEFAQAEYGLKPSTVSRFMNINRKYSIDGYSDQLRPEFAQLGSSKLSEMLSLQDQDMEMIKPEATREGIRELKQFTRGEAEVGVADDIQELIGKFFETNQETLNELFSSEAYTTGEVEKLVEIVNPSGNKTFKKGLYFLMMYEHEIKIKKFGQNPQTMTWAEFFSVTQEIFGEAAAGHNTWQNYFGGGEDDTDAAGERNTGDVQKTDTKGFGEVDAGEKNPSEAGPGDRSDNTGSVQPDDGGPKEDTDGAKDDAAAEESSQSISEGTGTGTSTEPTGTESQTEEIAPAQKNAEILERDVPDEAESEDDSAGYTARKLSNQESKTEAGKKTEETGSGTEIVDYMNMPEKAYGTRKEYMDTLTIQEMAKYLSGEYKGRRLIASSLAFPSELEKWLIQEVDESGKEVLEG